MCSLFCTLRALLADASHFYCPFLGPLPARLQKLNLPYFYFVNNLNYLRLHNKEIRRHKFLCVYATKPYVHHTCTSTTNVCTLLRMYNIVVLGLRAHLRQYLLVSFILCRMYNIVVLGLRAHLRRYLLCQKFCMTNNSSNNFYDVCTILSYWAYVHIYDHIFCAKNFV